MTNENNKIEYLKYEKLLKIVIRIAKTNFEFNYLKKANTKTMWKYVNKKLNKKQ